MFFGCNFKVPRHLSKNCVAIIFGIVGGILYFYTNSTAIEDDNSFQPLMITNITFVWGRILMKLCLQNHAKIIEIEHPPSRSTKIRVINYIKYDFQFGHHFEKEKFEGHFEDPKADFWLRS